MNTRSAPSYKRHRFPTEIISHAVWLYVRFSLSYLHVDELHAARGIVVTYATIRQWCQTLGQRYAHQLRRRGAQPGNTWHLDEVFLKINATTHDLWRAVDQHGTVRDMRVQRRRNKDAAKTFSVNSSKDLRMFHASLSRVNSSAMVPQKLRSLPRSRIGNTNA